MGIFCIVQKKLQHLIRTEKDWLDFKFDQILTQLDAQGLYHWPDLQVMMEKYLLILQLDTIKFNCTMIPCHK